MTQIGWHLAMVASITCHSLGGTGQSVARLRTVSLTGGRTKRAVQPCTSTRPMSTALSVMFCCTELVSVRIEVRAPALRCLRRDPSTSACKLKTALAASEKWLGRKKRGRYVCCVSPTETNKVNFHSRVRAGRPDACLASVELCQQLWGNYRSQRRTRKAMGVRKRACLRRDVVMPTYLPGR